MEIKAFFKKEGERVLQLEPYGYTRELLSRALAAWGGLLAVCAVLLAPSLVCVLYYPAMAEKLWVVAPASFIGRNPKENLLVGCYRCSEMKYRCSEMK